MNVVQTEDVKLKKFKKFVAQGACRQVSRDVSTFPDSVPIVVPGQKGRPCISSVYFDAHLFRRQSSDSMDPQIEGG